jgi:hypothetical protein
VHPQTTQQSAARKPLAAVAPQYAHHSPALQVQGCRESVEISSVTQLSNPHQSYGTPLCNPFPSPSMCSCPGPGQPDTRRCRNGTLHSQEQYQYQQQKWEAHWRDRCGPYITVEASRPPPPFSCACCCSRRHRLAPVCKKGWLLSYHKQQATHYYRCCLVIINILHLNKLHPYIKDTPGQVTVRVTLPADPNTWLLSPAYISGCWLCPGQTLEHRQKPKIKICAVNLLEMPAESGTAGRAGTGGHCSQEQLPPLRCGGWWIMLGACRIWGWAVRDEHQWWGEVDSWG